MVGANTLKIYDFNTIDQYNNYICESIVNGQRKQAKELINKLSKQQKKDAVKYFARLEGNTYLGHYRETKELIEELI